MDLDSTPILKLELSFQWSPDSPPKSESSPANQEMSTEWMFSWILAVRDDDEWMRAKLTMEKRFKTIGDVFKETLSLLYQPS